MLSRSPCPTRDRIAQADCPIRCCASLDAIHLATALLIREDVETLLTYDDRLAAAARRTASTAAPA